MKAPQSVIKQLDTFLAEKSVNDINRNTFIICNLSDSVNKITISLVFLRDWDCLESDSYSSVVLERKGAVFTFPCYWVSIPKELAMGYLEYIISEFYDSKVSEWVGDNSLSDGNGSLSGNNCPCC